MNLDERIEALTMNLELAHRELADHRGLLEEHRGMLQLQAQETGELLRLVQIDAENIRALAQIAEAHERRLDRMDDNG